MQEFNIDREFIKWADEDDYDGLGNPRNSFLPYNSRWWVYQAYLAGAKRMANETRCILGDYAAACEGLDPELLTPSEVFDRAEYNLEHYYNQVFKQET